MCIPPRSPSPVQLCGGHVAVGGTVQYTALHWGTGTVHCVLCNVHKVYSKHYKIFRKSTRQASPALHQFCPPVYHHMEQVATRPAAATGEYMCKLWWRNIRIYVVGGIIREYRLAVQNFRRSMGIQTLVNKQGEIGF